MLCGKCAVDVSPSPHACERQTLPQIEGQLLLWRKAVCQGKGCPSYRTCPAIWTVNFRLNSVNGQLERYQLWGLGRIFSAEINPGIARKISVQLSFFLADFRMKNVLPH